MSYKLENLQSAILFDKPSVQRRRIIDYKPGTILENVDHLVKGRVHNNKVEWDSSDGGDARAAFIFGYYDIRYKYSNNILETIENFLMAEYKL
jgi:hypothetical protein